MKAAHDIYVFYEKADNNRSEDEKYGWVDNFKRFLKMMLRQIIGEEPRFIELSEDKVPPVDQLSKARILVMIISPNAIKSGKYLKVLENFKNSRQQEETSVRMQSNEVFKVLKYPVAMADQPEELRSYIAYDLYDFNPLTGETKEFENFFSHEAETNFWMKLVDLAYDIHELLLQFQDTEDTDMEGRDRQAIYLAETGPELVVQRNMVKRELQRLGYTVFPKQNLPEDQDEIANIAGELLDRCFVTIHLMGDRVDIEEDGSSTTLVTLQNDIVSKYILDSNDEQLKNFSRLIWLSPNFKVTEEKHHRFIEKLRREVEDTGRTEIFQTPFEDFKFLLKRTLPEIPERLTESITGDEEHKKKKIYLIYDKKDSNNVTPLINLVNKKGYEVLKPVFDGNLMDIRQLHIQNLVDFDGVIIYSEEVNEFWVRMKLLDILKSPGFGRLKPLDKKAIFSSGGMKINKENFVSYEVDVIESDTITEKSLDPFLTKMN